MRSTAGIARRAESADAVGVLLMLSRCPLVVGRCPLVVVRWSLSVGRWFCVVAGALAGPRCSWLNPRAFMVQGRRGRRPPHRTAHQNGVPRTTDNEQRATA